MADFDPNAYAADAPAAPPAPAPTEPPAFDPNAYASDETPPNLGVFPMPSEESHRAALAALPTAQDAAPGAYTLGGPAFTAFRAQNAGVSSDEATRALGHARNTGLAPQFVADALPEVQAQQEQSGFEDGLGAAPITAAWAGQSAVHAAAVKPDIGFFEALEQGLVDVGYQELATLQMSYPTEAVEQTLQGYEAEAPEYEARPSPWYADLARNVPQIATYMLSGVLGKTVGGKAGEVGATAGMMFLMNRGSLYRRIMHEAPYPASDAEGVFDPEEYERKARVYATAGAGASAALGAGLSSAIGWMVPGAGKRVSDLSTGIIARAFTDPATRDVIGRLVGMGGHTLSGALQMAIPAVIDDATVQAAVRGSVDPGKAAAAGWQAFKTSILAAGALSVVPGLPGLVRDVGRIKMAEPEAGRLQHLVDQAQGAKLVKQAPAEAKELLGKMAGASDAPTVHVGTDALAQNPAATQALVESLADGGQAIAEAKATGSDVPVPIENYLVDLGEHHAALKDDVKLDPEGMTPREAREAPARGIGPEGMTGLGRIATPEEVAAASLEPSAVAPPPESPAVSAPEWGAIAERTIEAKTIGELQPGHYERAAKSASDRIAQRAAQAVTGQAAGVRQPGEGAALAQTVRLSDLTQARDLSRTLAKKAGEVRAEMDGLQDKLVRGYTDDARAKLKLADPAYLGVTDLLMGAVGLAPEVAGPQYGVADAVAKMSSDARLLGFDAQAIAELAADPKPWKDLTPAEARNLSDALASIRSAAKAETEIALVDRKQDLRAFVGDVQQHFDDIGAPDKGPPPPSRAGVGAFEGAKKKGAAVLAEMLRPEIILRRLGEPGEAIMDAFMEARNKKEDLARDVGEVVYKAYERDMPKELKKTRIDSVNGLPTDVVAAGKWVRQDLWTLAGWYGSESGADRLRSGLRVSDQDILATLGQLTKPEAEFIDKTHALNDEKLWPLVRDHEIATTGTSAPKVEARPFTVTLADGETHTFRGGYWPGKSQGTTAPPSEDTIAGYWGTLRNDIPATSKGFTKERTVRTSYIPDLNWSAYSSHVNSVLHYLAYDDFVRNAGRVFKDPEFRSLVERRLGTQEMDELDKFATVSARGSVEAPNGGAAQLNSVLGGAFRSRVATGAFQLNLPVVIGQLSHLPAAMFGMRISPIDMLQGVGKAFSPESWAEDHGESTQLPYRWNGYGTHMRELFADVGPEARVGWRKWIDAGGWSLYHTMDGFLSKSIYGAAKAQALRGGALAEEATAAGDKAVSMMMPPLNLAEQSSLARDRGVIGSLMLVRNFPNTLYNVGAMNAWQARTGIWSAAPGWQRATRIAGGSAAAAGAYLGMVLSAHIFGRFLMGHGRQEDETTPDWLERESLAAPFYPIPFASEVITPLAEAVVSGKSLKETMAFGHADIRAAPAIAMLQDAIRDYGRIIDEGSETPDRIQAAARLAGMALRLPVYPLKPLRYGFDVATGNVQPRGGLDLGAGFIYGQRPRQTRNPLTAGQDIASGEWQ